MASYSTSRHAHKKTLLIQVLQSSKPSKVTLYNHGLKPISLCYFAQWKLRKSVNIQTTMHKNKEEKLYL